MRIAVIEPLGLSRTVLEEHFRSLVDAGHRITYYDDRPSSIAETIRRLEGVDGAVITNLPFPREVIEAAHSLRFLSVAFTGVNHIDLDACRERGIGVSNAAGFSNESVAELTVAVVISLLRSVVPGDAALRSGGTNAGLFGRELHGKTVGVIGTGAIGRRVATILSAFGVRLLGYNRTQYPEMVELGMQYLSLDALLAASDIVTLHVPLTDQTRALISGERIAGMKHGAYLVNMARGAVVDSGALATALKEGRLAGAGIDVYETEPPIDPAHPLLGAPNTLLLPHVAFGTQESFGKRAEIVVENLHFWIDGAQKRIILPLSE